jgi:hypothetical protein
LSDGLRWLHLPTAFSHLYLNIVNPLDVTLPPPHHVPSLHDAATPLLLQAVQERQQLEDFLSSGNALLSAKISSVEEIGRAGQEARSLVEQLPNMSQVRTTTCGVRFASGTNTPCMGLCPVACSRMMQALFDTQQCLPAKHQLECVQLLVLNDVVDVDC